MSRAAYFETVTKGRDPKIAANWVITELLGALNKQGKTLDQSPVSADQLGGLIDLILDNTISGKIAKDVFVDMFATGKNASDIVEAKGLKQVTDIASIEKFVDDVIAKHPDIVEKYKGGDERVFGFLVGQVMKASSGKANPAMANELLKKKLTP